MRPARREGVVRNGMPVRVDQECGDDVSEQRDREPAQNVRDLVIPQQHGRGTDAQAEDPHVPV
jgi:hypothetical protein